MAGATWTVSVAGKDAGGTIVPSYSSNITISIQNNGGSPTSGTLSGTAVQTASSGTSTFTGMSIDKIGTAYTLTATDGTFTAPASSAFNISPDVPSVLSFLTQPTDAALSGVISPAPEVRALDAYGNLVSGYSGNITVAIGTNPEAAR